MTLPLVVVYEEMLAKVYRTATRAQLERGARFLMRRDQTSHIDNHAEASVVTKELDGIIEGTLPEDHQQTVDTA